MNTTTPPITPLYQVGPSANGNVTLITYNNGTSFKVELEHWMARGLANLLNQAIPPDAMKYFQKQEAELEAKKSTTKPHRGFTTVAIGPS